MPKEWEKSVWKQQYFRDYEDFIGAVLELKQLLEEGVGCNPYRSPWWQELQAKVNTLTHHHAVLEVTRRKYVEAHPLEPTIPFGHFPVARERNTL